MRVLIIAIFHLLETVVVEVVLQEVVLLLELMEVPQVEVPLVKVLTVQMEETLGILVVVEVLVVLV